MLTTLRLIPILVVATVVLMLNPNRSLGLWVLVVGAAIFVMVLSEISFPVPENQAQARRWFLHAPFAIFLVGQLIVARVTGYDMITALRVIALTTGPLVVSVFIVSGIRRLARLAP